MARWRYSSGVTPDHFWKALRKTLGAAGTFGTLLVGAVLVGYVYEILLAAHLLG